mgnify:CR=1 FL=1
MIRTYFQYNYANHELKSGEKIMYDFDHDFNTLFDSSPPFKDIKNPTILELGVQEGRSTKMFLEVCDENDGNLISVDILDCSKVSNNPRWKFIHASDDNFKVINQHLNKNYV